MVEFAINYGALSDDISKQIHKRTGLDAKQFEHLNELDEAIFALYLNDIITDNEKRKANERLHKTVTKCVKDALKNQKG